MSQMAIKTQTLNDEQCDHCNGYCYLSNCKLSLKNCYEDPYVRNMPIFSVSIFSTCERNETEWRWWELLEYKSTCVTIIISILQYVRTIPFMSKMNINSTNWPAHNVCNVGQNVKTNGCYLVLFQDKALESTGNYKDSSSSPPSPKIQCWTPAWSFLTPTNQLWSGWGEGRGHSGTKSTGYAFCGKESTKFLTPFFQDCGSSYSCSSVGWALQC